MRDKRMIALMQAGERGALDRVIEHYTPYISVIVHRILSPTLPKEEIEEAVADVFITLWRNVDKLTGDSLKGYLAAIARSQAISRLRRARLEYAELDQVTDAQPSPDALAIERERAELLREVIEELGLPDSEIFLRYYYEQQSINTIADALRLSPSAVKSRLLRGRKKLRERLTERGVTLEELL